MSARRDAVALAAQAVKMRALVLVDYLLARLQEPSTIRAIVWLVSGGAVHWRAETAADNLISLAMLAAGLVGALLPERLRQRYTDMQYPPRRRAEDVAPLAELAGEDTDPDDPSRGR